VVFPIALISAGWQPQLLLPMFCMWFVQMTGVLLGYHRFFSHRGFDTSRPFAVFIALLGAISGQGGPLFWAAHHRHHHKHCEKPGDPHSPYEYQKEPDVQTLYGFLYAQGLYLWNNGMEDFNLVKPYIQDWMRFPELVLLDQYCPIIFFSLGPAIAYVYGYSTMAYVWCGATCLSWNCVQFVNSVVHMVGERRYVVKVSPDCQSRNVWWLSPFMLGANWHNNHHAFPNCAREGFEWYEIDVLYYVLRVWQALGLVWNVRQPKYKDMQLRDDYKPGTYTSLGESICSGLGPLKTHTEPSAPRVHSPRKVKM